MNIDIAEFKQLIVDEFKNVNGRLDDVNQRLNDMESLSDKRTKSLLDEDRRIYLQSIEAQRETRDLLDSNMKQLQPIIDLDKKIKVTGRFLCRVAEVGRHFVKGLKDNLAAISVLLTFLAVITHSSWLDKAMSILDKF